MRLVFGYAQLVSIAGELAVVGEQIGRSKLSLGSLQERRRALIVEALAAGMTEREIAALGRCAPSHVHQVAAAAVGRVR